MIEQTNAELIAEARERITALGMAANPVSLTFCLAEALEAADQRAKSAEQGLYDVYDALGFDKDGARTPRELFGPMVNGTPAEIVVEAAKEFREDSEREADEADQRAVQAEAELRDAFRTDIPSLKDQRDALAAVVEKVREEATAAQRDADLGQWADDLLAIITTAPADALREHDAKVRALANQERDQIAAVIEQAEDYVTRHYLDTRFGDEVLPFLATAPADALRELKADVWDEGHHAGLRQADYEYGAAGFQVVKPNPYRREEQGRG